ncbi:DegV family protein [Pseudomonas aeruginosa]|uniref:DegV family protein n=1 Tax=Pseudomonas aeruginosa TaxID=287 RepID=UPI00104C1697|nr:DegV family protein [Pseudomonas aeruginosa]
MRIGLVVDATCDLPPEFLAAHGIRVMPIGIRLGEQRLIDRRDPDTTLSFYRDHLPKVGSKDGSQPLSAAELQQWFLDELVTDFDYVVCLTVDSLRSPIFEHATQASFGLLQHYHERRHAAGIAGPFTLRVLDSHSVFAGIACLAAEGTRLLAQGSHPNALRTRLEQLSQQTCTYLVADDLGHLRRRGFQKGDRSGFVDRVKGAALGLGSLLDVKPVFSLADGEDKPSYAGDPTALRDLPGFAALENACRERDIHLHLGMLSPTGGINLGAGAMSLGFIATPKAFA